MKKLQNILHKVSNSLIFQILALTLGLMAVAYLLLETKSAEITFVYYNF